MSNPIQSNKKSLIRAAVLASLASAAPAWADIDTGLAARWSFDDCTANDSSANKNNGTTVGGLKCVTGISGKAMQFDGSTGYITVPDSASLKPDNQWAISFWIKVQDTTNTWSPIIHKGGPKQGTNFKNEVYAVWLNNTLYFEQDSAGDNSGIHQLNSTKIANSKWVHYVGVIDRAGHVALIFLNGKKVAEASDSYNGFNTNNHELWIGGTEETDSSYGPFQGILDDIRLYNRALTPDDIAELYNMSKPIAGTTTGLQQITVTCTNTKTKQTVTIPTQTATAWDCKKAGLKTAPGQTIHIGIDGNTYP